jgi:uncharacterized Tic20 family protein
MGAPIPGTPPPGYANSDEKTWALVAHFGSIIFGFLAPLVALLAKGNESPTVRAHAVEALNFQITWNAVYIVGWILAACSGGFLTFIPLFVWIFWSVFAVIAGLRANEGQLYTYPAKLTLVR